MHKARKQMVKLPWEKLTPFVDFLRSLPSSHGRAGMDDEDEEDEDEMQAYEDSMQRLKVRPDRLRARIPLTAGCG